jgi:hypothetical protein
MYVSLGNAALEVPAVIIIKLTRRREGLERGALEVDGEEEGFEGI